MTTDSNQAIAPTSEVPEPPALRRPWHWYDLGLLLRVLQVRFRFIGVLVVAFLVAGQWDTLRNYWDTMTRYFTGVRPLSRAVSSDTEYFCPMDPGVISDWPSKCGICNMELVRRKTGDTGPLPSGIIARMQLSPYRVQLAGIRTARTVYGPLVRETNSVGTVRDGEDQPIIEAQLSEREWPYVKVGNAVEVTSETEMGRHIFRGKIQEFIRADTLHGPLVRMSVGLQGDLPRPGTPVAIRVFQAVADQEPFRSMPSNPPPIRKGEARAVFFCTEHPEVLAEGRGRCPVDPKDELERQPLLENQRLGWWCPMHPQVTADHPGGECRVCGGMKLVPQVVTYRPPGQVLTVPESAVVDTGTRTVVFVERMSGMFDGVEVTLGPRCGETYPVIRGLEPGQRVAIAGAFLLDAETRLNPSLAAGYFGAGAGPHSEEPRSESPPKVSALSPDDQTLATQQKVCPVTGKPLGSMGPPQRVVVAGKTVLICCEGCEERLRKTPEKYLPKLP